MADYRWYVGLEGHELDLVALSDFLSQDPTLVTRRDDGQWYITGSLFQELDDPTDVRDRAEELIQVLNGVGALFAIERVKIGSTVLEYAKDGVRRHAVILADTLTVTGRVHAVVFGADGKPKPNEKAPLFRRITQLAESNRRVSDPLHFLTQHRTWANLYKVFEVVRDDVGEKVYSLVDSTKLRSFTGTAQSRRLLGDQARHASDRYTGPKNPLSLEEAHSLIRELVHAWVTQHPGLREEQSHPNA